MECKIDGNKAILLKEDLERKAEHYWDLSTKYRATFRRLYYLGKRDVVIDILKQFEESNG
jgi:hypothetical protein